MLFFPLRPRSLLVTLAFFIAVNRSSSALSLTPRSLFLTRYHNLVRRDMTSRMDDNDHACPTPCGGFNDFEAHPSTLPGDPSLILTTNLDLKDKKIDIMKGQLPSDFCM
jgi:hypothetical protein